MEDVTFWVVAGVVIGCVGVAVSVVAAVAAVVSAIYARNANQATHRYHLPPISIQIRRQPDGRPHVVTFRLSPEHRWELKSVKTRGIRPYRSLALPGDAVTLDGLEGYEFGGLWQRCVKYDAPVFRGTLLLHPRYPKRVHLKLQLCFTTDPRSETPMHWNGRISD